MRVECVMPLRVARWVRAVLWAAKILNRASGALIRFAESRGVTVDG